MNKRAPGSYQDPNTKIACEEIVFLSDKGFGDNGRNATKHQDNNNNKEFLHILHNLRNYSILLLHTALVKIDKLFLIKKWCSFIRKGGVYHGKTH